MQFKYIKTTDYKNQINTGIPPVVGDHLCAACEAENRLLLHDLSACSADKQRLETAWLDPIREHCAEAWEKKHEEIKSFTHKEVTAVQLIQAYSLTSGH